MITLTNLNAMRSAAAMAESSADIKTSMERLSTGSRINAASDDAAGLAISARMDTQILGLAKAIANGSDAIGLLSTADGALGEVSSLLQRMRELSLQSATGSVTAADRTYLNDEYQRLKNEIDRIGSQTQWNGMNIFDGVSFPGTTQFQVGANANQVIGVEMAEVSTWALTATSIMQLGSDIDGEAPGDYSGTAVSLSGDGTTVVIGAPGNDGGAPDGGHARIYRYNSGTSSWVQLGSDIDASTMYDSAGSSVSISYDGSTVAVGAPLNRSGGTERGQTRIYKYDSVSSAWIQLGSAITGSLLTGKSGYEVSISDDGARIGVLSQNSLAKIYQYDAQLVDWVQLGSEISDPYASAGFGSFEALSLSGDGSTIAIGSDGKGTLDPGFTSVFRFDSATSRWIQLGSDIAGEWYSDRSGGAVSLSKDGSTVAIGAVRNAENGTRSGHTRIYRYDDASTTWIQLGSDIDGEAAWDESGHAVSISDDGSVVSIGALLNDGGGDASGHTRVYRFDEKSSTWKKIGSDIDGETAGDLSGYATSISTDGSTVAVGARNNDGIGKADSGHVRVHKLTNLTFSTLTSQGDSTTALTLIDQAHSNLSTMRATYGAVINQITHAIDNLGNTLVNTESSESRIADTDYAKESSNLASAQIRNQGAKAMLAQANTDQQLTLSLLEDWL